MPSFEALPLEDIQLTFRKVFDFRVSLSQGKLYGLSNLKRWERSFINATDSGITAHFKIEGGPLELTYTGTVRSVPLDAQVMVNVIIPRIELFINVDEPSKKTTEYNQGTRWCETDAEEEGGQTWLDVAETGRGSSDLSGCGLEVSAGSHLGPNQTSKHFGPSVVETSPGRSRQARLTSAAASASQRSRPAWQTPCVLPVNDLYPKPRSWLRLAAHPPC
ncbi:hypothetical protein MTO96_028236 [Rhipicephalus appendiculatus]